MSIMNSRARIATGRPRAAGLCSKDKQTMAVKEVAG